MTASEFERQEWRRLGVPHGQADLIPGLPVLFGPYTVDYTDIPAAGDKKTLWTPAVGDVLLRLFPDYQTVVEWDRGILAIGPNVDTNAHNEIVAVRAGQIVNSSNSALDMVFSATIGNGTAADGSAYTQSAYVFHATDPVQIQLFGTTYPSGPDAPPTQGHVELYALIARAVAP